MSLLCIELNISKRNVLWTFISDMHVKSDLNGFFFPIKYLFNQTLMDFCPIKYMYNQTLVDFCPIKYMYNQTLEDFCPIKYMYNQTLVDFCPIKYMYNQTLFHLHVSWQDWWFLFKVNQLSKVCGDFNFP